MTIIFLGKHQKKVQKHNQNAIEKKIKHTCTGNDMIWQQDLK